MHQCKCLALSAWVETHQMEGSDGGHGGVEEGGDRFVQDPVRPVGVRSRPPKGSGHQLRVGKAAAAVTVEEAG